MSQVCRCGHHLYQHRENPDPGEYLELCDRCSCTDFVLRAKQRELPLTVPQDELPLASTRGMPKKRTS